MKLVEVSRYREKVVSGAKFPREHRWMQELWGLIPSKKRDNHVVAIFDMGKDSWGRDNYVAVYFYDFNCFVGSLEDIRNGDVYYEV